MIDLHSHTTASDGTLAPEELVRQAAAAGIRTLAVTDHDTTAAVAACIRAVEEQALPLRIVPGIELSARWKGREVHVLGHFLDPDHEELLGHLASFRDDRRSRMEAMVARLRSLKLDVSMEEVDEIRGGEGSYGRPHLARLLVAKGHARDFQDAFDRWIGKGSPGWVERPFPDATEAIALIRRAGGCAAVAHPALSGLFEPDLRALTGAGLAGLEVDHPGHTPDVRRSLRELARKLGLSATAGSDFHAAGDDGSRLGTEGMETSDFAAYERRSGKA